MTQRGNAKKNNNKNNNITINFSKEKNIITESTVTQFKQSLILRRRFISTKQIYKKNHTYNTKHTIYKRKEIKAKKRLEILKEGRKRNGGGHYVIQTIERHNPFKLFSLYTFYAID